MDFNGISPRWWIARRIELGLSYGVPCAAFAALSSRQTFFIWAAVAFFLIGMVAWFVERARYLRWGYAERSEDLVVRRGYLFQHTSIVPYGRMQFIDVKAGPVERVFGLATVQLHTAAAASDARIPGLPRAEAERLRDRLTSAGEAKATGL